MRSHQLMALFSLTAVAVVVAGCDPGAELFIDNRTSEAALVRVNQDPHVGPLVYRVPPHATGWAIHPVDLYRVTGPVDVLTRDCAVVASFAETGVLVIDGAGAHMSRAAGDLPAPERRVPLTSACGGPTSADQ